MNIHRGDVVFLSDDFTHDMISSLFTARNAQSFLQCWICANFTLVNHAFDCSRVSILSSYVDVNCFFDLLVFVGCETTEMNRFKALPTHYKLKEFL